MNAGITGNPATQGTPPGRSVRAGHPRRRKANAAGFDEARLGDALTWTVRTRTLTFHGRGNHAKVSVTDDGRATPPTVWTIRATLPVAGEIYTSNEVTLRVYAASP